MINSWDRSDNRDSVISVIYDFWICAIICRGARVCGVRDLVDVYLARSNKSLGKTFRILYYTKVVYLSLVFLNCGRKWRRNGILFVI